MNNKETNTMTKQDVKNQIEELANEMKVTFIEAASAMQTASATMGNEEMIGVIGELKLESLGL